jgi:hypothetical protein
MATQIEIGDKTFEIGKLDAYNQFHVLRRALPVVKPVLLVLRNPGGASKLDMFMAVAEPLATLPDEQLDYIRDRCMAVVRRRDGERSFPMVTNGVLMYRDLDMMTMLRLIWAVLEENFEPFSKGLLGAPSKDEDPILRTQ